MPENAPVSPSNGGRALKYGALGALAGIVLAFAFFVLRSFFDVIVRNENDLKEAVELPVLGQIPFYMGAPSSEGSALKK